MTTESLNESENIQKKSTGNPTFDMTTVFSALESSQPASGNGSQAVGSSHNVEEELAAKAKKLVQEIQGPSSSSARTKVAIDKSIIVKEHVELLIREFEIDKLKAEQALSLNGGDLIKTMLTLVC